MAPGSPEALKHFLQHFFLIFFFLHLLASFLHPLGSLRMLRSQIAEIAADLSCLTRLDIFEHFEHEAIKNGEVFSIVSELYQ